MKKTYGLLGGYLTIKITEWSGYLLMRWTILGYRLRLLTLKQAVSGLSYSNTLTKRALKQLRIIREKRRVERVEQKKSSE